MGLFSSLFGKKPKAPVRQGYTAADQALMSEAGKLQDSAARYLPFQNTRLALAANSQPAQDAGARVAAVTAMQEAGPQATQGRMDATDVRGFNPLVARVRAVSRAAGMGDEQARMQALRDRVGLVKYGRGLRSGAYSALAGVAGNEGGMQSIANQAALTPDYMQPYKSNFLGTLAGSAYRAWEENRTPAFDAAAASRDFDTAIGSLPMPPPLVFANTIR